MPFTHVCRSKWTYDVKNLRLACREYAYLPRLLSHLFGTMKMAVTPEYVNFLDTTILSLINPYIRCIVFKTNHEYGYYPSDGQSTWVELFRRLPNVTAFCLGDYSDPQVMEEEISTITTSLEIAGTRITYLDITHETEYSLLWSYDRMNLSNLRILAFNPFEVNEEDGSSEWSGDMLTGLLRNARRVSRIWSSGRTISSLDRGPPLRHQLCNV